MSVKVIDYWDKNAPQEFALGLKEIGFAVVTHHPLNIPLINEGYAKWVEFFHSPQRRDFAFDKKNHDGYSSPSLSETAKGYNKKDLKEFYHFYPWGRCPDLTRPVTMALYNELNQIAATLLSWIEGHLPQAISAKLSMPLSNMIKDSQTTLFRLIHYPPLTGHEEPGALRAAPHEDINLITLLPAATAKGLQVKDTQGRWLEVPCDPGWIIVNAGDMLQECTEHYYPSTTHRVINPTGEDALKPRLSMPLFLHPRDDVQLSPRHTAKSYRWERYQELGLT